YYDFVQLRHLVLAFLRPPISPSFPYTTLFRSLLPASSRIRVIQIGGAMSEQAAIRARTEMKTNDRYSWLGEQPAWRVRRILERRDRKSTRLNSSHDWISYAVFCLKKKKRKNNNINHNQNRFTLPNKAFSNIVKQANESQQCDTQVSHDCLQAQANLADTT